ncbi:glutamate formimidoyltransferase [candidate division KSB1 bacterium 4484_87]|nr:MAG: glutamate formimidoyltransferase [candidate division KSB1 bacterium 4484_87]
MLKLVECVPNFSEGKNLQVIEAIVDEIRDTEDVKLLDVDPGADTNRTVVTFIGSPEGVKEAAFRAIKKAAELIDMRHHKGEHARMGATDVCPFVPVSGVTMEDCVQIAKEVGERVAAELGIPVYLYEEAATRPERKSLADIRKGEYEGLPEKLKDPEWKPDFGEAIFNEKSGATVIGAREFLIAYNVNLNTRDRKLAHDIALTIREAGRAKRDAAGKIIRDADGKAVKVPGRLQACRAVGWYIDEYSQAQVSMNLINYKITPPHLAFDVVCEEAEKRGLRVTGSELVGLIPLQAMLDAGRHYLLKQGKSPGVPEEDLIEAAVVSMGLRDVSEFDPAKKIIEYQVREAKGPLVKMDLRDFANELSSESPAPGGGSVSALAGALASSLSGMVANLTSGKKSYESVWEEMNETAVEAQHLKDELLRNVDRDTEAFNQLMAAFSMKKKTEEQIALRNDAIENATKFACEVPLSVMEFSVKVLQLAKVVAEKGNDNAASDAGVSALMARSAVYGAGLNVKINLPGIQDSEFVEKMKYRVDELLTEAEKLQSEVLEIVNKKIESM